MEIENNAAVLIFEQLNNLLLEKQKGSNLLDHNLEKGLANEQIFRDLLIDFLPAKYGVAKGKVINSNGIMSKQCDIILYDKLTCPTLFIDDNKNQIIPIGGVYFIAELKTKLNKTNMREAFENLYSVYKISNGRPNRSNNEKVEVCPPGLTIISFDSSCSLDTLAKHYKLFSQEFKVAKSFHSFSEKSPGFKKHTGEKILVESIVVLNKGEIHHMHHGAIDIMPYGKYTLGIYLTGLIMILNWIVPPEVELLSYLNWVTVEKLLNGSKRKKG